MCVINVLFIDFPTHFLTLIRFWLVSSATTQPAYVSALLSEGRYTYYNFFIINLKNRHLAIYIYIYIYIQQLNVEGDFPQRLAYSKDKVLRARDVSPLSSVSPTEYQKNDEYRSAAEGSIVTFRTDSGDVLLHREVWWYGIAYGITENLCRVDSETQSNAFHKQRDPQQFNLTRVKPQYIRHICIPV